MTATALSRSAATDVAPPAELTPAIRALWLAKAGRWDGAHDLCQEISGSNGCWIHAYLHRVEGDPENAAYWYARAGKPVPAASVTTEEEWHDIATMMLAIMI